MVWEKRGVPAIEPGRAPASSGTPSRVCGLPKESGTLLTIDLWSHPMSIRGATVVWATGDDVGWETEGHTAVQRTALQAS